MSVNNDKLLLFAVAHEIYGVSINKVRQVMQYEAITAVRSQLDYVKGVINLRGKIVPIIDMRLKFGMEEVEYTDRTIFIIFDIEGEHNILNLGIVVDKVLDVIDTNEEELEKTPDVGLKVKNQFLYGIAKHNDSMIMVLNIDKILTADEIINLDSVKKE